MSAALTALIARCRVLCRPRLHDSDAELLRRVTQTRDAAAFEELLERHAVLVWGVCRRILPSEADCEDAFQATFLALVRRPPTLPSSKLGEGGGGAKLAAWLHTVAMRVARKALARGWRQQPQAELPEQATAGDIADVVGNRELFRLVDEEIERLPVVLRVPLVLCCLEGRTRDEAADVLGCSISVVKGRLERGRDLLRRNLERRGVELPATFLMEGLTAERIRAALWAKTMQAAMYTPPPLVAALADVDLSALTIGKGKMLVAALLTVSVAAGAIGMMRTQEPPDTRPSPPAKALAEEKQAETTRNRADRPIDPLPLDAIARLGTVRFRHGYGVTSVAFSPDGKMLTAGGMGRVISLWDAATGKELRRFPSDRGQPARVAFSPDGKVLASVSTADALVCLYDAKTGKELRLLQGHQSGVSCVTFSPDGKFLASGDIKGTVHLWEPVVGNLALRPPGQTDDLRHVSGDWGHLHAMTFSPDSKLLAFAAEDGKIRLWNPRIPDEIRLLNGHPTAITSLSFSPDGKFLASAGQDKTIRLWATATGEQVRVLGEKPDMVLCVAFSPDGRLLASAHRDGKLAVCDAHTGRIVRCWQGHAFAAVSVAFSPDGKRLASAAAWDSSVRLWHATTGTELHTFDGHDAAVKLVRWQPDGKTLVSIDRTGHALWWDLPTQRSRRRVVHPPPAWSVFALAADNETLAGGGFSDGSIRLGSIASDKSGRLLGTQEQMIQVMALSPNARLLAIGRRDLALRLWDVRGGQVVRSFEGPGKVVWCLAFSPDSKVLAYGINQIGNGADDKTLRLVDVTNGKVIHTFASRSRVSAIAFSPDGKVMASWHERYPDESFVCLWDVASGKELRRHAGHPAGGSGVISFSPDGKLVASAGGLDKNSAPVIHLWEAATGRLIRGFAGHHSGVNSLAFSPDGLQLASGGGDSTILVWDITGRRVDGRGRAKPLTSRDLDACWTALKNEDSARAYDAVWALVADAQQAVPFLQKHLPPVPRADAKTIARLIADLDSDDYQARQKAAEELGKYGDAVSLALQRALDGNPSLEVRRRVQQLLDRTRDWTAERLRDHRAIQILEHIGTWQTKELLQALAKGAPEARRTEEAKAALLRLAR